MSDYIDMTNEEIWEMLRPKLVKNGLDWIHYGYDSEGHKFYYFDETALKNAVAIAYKGGYYRSQKGRPFKFGEKKKKELMEYQSLAFKGKDGKWHLAPRPNLLENPPFFTKRSGHWEPVDPNNLPKEGTRVRLNKPYDNYYGGIIEAGTVGCVFHDASYGSRVNGYGVNFGEYKTIWFPLNRTIIADCLDMWVEDDE